MGVDGLSEGVAALGEAQKRWLRVSNLAVRISPSMLSASQVQSLLAPFGVNLTSGQTAQLLTYLDLLVKWNRKINLTAIPSAEECVTRHFGESLHLARWFELRGTLLDIGSGAGFPGLALKIAFPNLATTLLEPTAKKRAFLKEVCRACRMGSVEVRAERLEDFARRPSLVGFANVTSRALGHFEQLVPLAVRCLAPGARLFLWVSRDQGVTLAEAQAAIDWKPPIPLPLARQREIWVGELPGQERQGSGARD